MAKFTFDKISKSDISLIIDTSGFIGNDNEKKIKKGTAEAVAEFISEDYTNTVNSIMSLYQGRGLSRSSYKTHVGTASVNHPDYSKQHKKKLKKLGISPSKPFWGKVQGGLTQYASGTKVRDDSKLTITSLDKKVDKNRIKSFFSNLISGKSSDKITVLSVKANVTLPTINRGLLETLIPEHYLRGFGEDFDSFSHKVRSEGRLDRPEHTIIAEEDYRPLIAPVANLTSKNAVARFNGELEKSLATETKKGLLGRFVDKFK